MDRLKILAYAEAVLVCVLHVLIAGAVAVLGGLVGFVMLGFVLSAVGA